ncbi:MAG: metallophosphatase [Prevotellaceae bacterium]|jgi:5'-nucleotidase|nr:metallophosphatase [Prevotellaceae bacterium]
MRKLDTSIYSLATFFLAFGLIACQPTPQTLEIYCTNDVHSRVYPFDEHAPDTDLAGKGGLIRAAKAAQAYRLSHPDLLLFDSGDFSQGTPYYNLFHGDLEIELMNAAGYNAGTLGNHEFDLGMENLARLLRKAKFPILCANYNVEGSLIEGLIKPYTIIERKGLRIGVFGLGVALEGLVSKTTSQGVTDMPPYPIANETVAELRRQGCDLVICLSHLGLLGNTPDAICDKNLARNTRGIDIILGGHSHTTMMQPEYITDLDGHEVLITQSGTGAVRLGHLEVTIK